MKKNVLSFGFLVALLVGAGSVWGQTAFTATYDLSGGGNDVLSFNYNGIAITGATANPLLKVGIASSSSSGNFRGAGWPTGTTIDLGKYIQFSIMPNSCYQITITSITFGVGRSGTGPTQWQWRGSADSYGSAINNYTTLNAGLTNSSGVLTNPDLNSGWPSNVLNVSSSYTNISSTATFRLYGYNAEAAGGTGGLQANITIQGTYTNLPPPTTQASSFSASGITDIQMNISWTRGSGNEVIVLAKRNGPVDANPVNGTTYAANTVFGSGEEIGTENYVVYKGIGTNATITGLISEDNYYFAVYEYNTTSNCYLTPALTGSQMTLPITLEKFDATKLRSSVLLTWRTASERNNDYIAVERSSDALRWEELGRVAGAGTTPLPQSYSFSDEKPLPGLNYYRLRQVDFDGRFEYHKTIAVDFNTERGGLHLFPSPAQDRLNVALPAPAEQESELWLLDVQGRILQRMVIPQGGTQGAFEVAKLPEGVYFVRMAMGDLRSFRFVK